MTSIREQVLAREFVVENQGLAQAFQMADCLEGLTEEILDNKESLCEFLDKRGILLEMIHCGIQKFTIDQRGIARPKDKKGIALAYTDKLVEEIQAKLSAQLPLSLPKPSEKLTPKTKKQLLDEKWEQMEITLKKNNVDENTIAVMKVSFYK